MKRIAIVLVMLYPLAAEAHHHCHETSTVVGEQTCSRFGAAWGGTTTLVWDFGLGFRSFRFDAIDREVDTNNGRVHVTSDSTPGASTDLVFRAVYNLLEHFHVVTELSLGRLCNLPELMMSPSAREMTPPSSDARGLAMWSMLGAGVHASRSGFLVGAELGVAPHMVLFRTDRLPGTYFGQGGVAVEARLQAGFWVSPHWTVSGLVSTNVLSSDEHSFMVALGLHAFPYDGSR